jgi:predicted CxxxxCH...CXXCH cytochrome family protein
VAPNTGNHPVSGAKHAAYLGTGTGSCVKCHADHTVDAKPFAHATSAGNRSIDVHFTAAPNSGGTFASNQCSNLYCHSNGAGGPANTVPTWGGTLDCKGCHNSDLASGSPMASGKHGAHINNAAVLGTNLGCVECHAQTVSNNTTIGDYTKHVKGFVSFSGSRAGHSYTSATGVCSAVYCHSDGKGNYKDMTVTNWKSAATLDCKGCHGSDSAPAFTSAAGEPNYANGGAGALRANTHQTHVGAAADCANCHSATTSNGTSITANGKHTNGTVDLSPGNGKNFTYSNDATKTCSNISCHSGNGIIASVGSAQWGASLGCAGCHGDSSTLTSNAHQKHVNALLGKGYTCDTCHNLTVSGSSTIIDKTKHGDGTVEINGASIPSASYTAATKSCATSCHNSIKPANTPQWGNTASGACGTCHNALSNTANGLIGTNAHTTHFSAAYGPGFNGTTASSCAICHSYTTDTAATHANGSVDLGAGFNKIGTCSTCHQQSTNWTTGRVACESCHTTTNGPLSVIGGITAPDKTLAASAGHGRTGIGKACTDCHDNTSAHIGVAGGTSRLQSALGTGNANCTYCHNDPAKVTNTVKQITQVHVGFANNCAICHELHGTTNSNMVQPRLSSVTVAFGGSDFVNAQGTGVCQACHTGTTYYKRNVAEANHPTSGCTTCHPHKGYDGLTAFEPNRACDSCHGYPPAPRATTSAVTFGVQGNWSSARFEDYSGGGGAHVVAAHLAKTIKPSDGFAPCLACHSGAQASHTKAMPLRNHVENVTVLVDPQYRFSNDYFIAYTSAKLVSGGANKTGSCFNVSCHFTTSPKWSIER